MKDKETLEEAAHNHQKGNYDWQNEKRLSFIAGAKWQSERMYSEEEVYNLLLKHQSDYRSAVRQTSPLNWSFDITKWFKQFKKK
jgi:hypothetical protein